MSEEQPDSNSSAHHVDDNDSDGFTGAAFCILLVLMVTLALVIFLGNALVILAFKVEKSLRRQCNYYFLNLAISDILVGAVSIPFYIPYILTGKWTLGRGLCKMWLVVDYLLASASTFNIVLISYDRYHSVTRAVSFRARQSMTRQAIMKMAAVWVLAFALYGPAIIFWELATGKSEVAQDHCEVDFFNSWIYLLSGAAVEFFFPLVSVTFFNVSIYLNIRRRRFKTKPHIQVNEPSSTQGDSVTLDSQISAASMGKLDQAATKPQPTRLSRDRKVARSLAIIVCAFGICWGPYIVLTIIRAVCKPCVNSDLYEFSFWLLWLNSAINPFLYPLCHSSFRKAFAKILCGKRRRAASVLSSAP